MSPVEKALEARLNAGIAALKVDPDAEPIQTNGSTVSAEEEIGFYRDAGIEYQLLQNQQNLGVIGKFIGAKSAASTNVVVIVVVCSFVALIFSLFLDDMSEVRTGLFSTISGSMGYLFGSNRQS